MGGAEEIHGASLEREEEMPLLHKKNSSRWQQDGAVSLIDDGQPYLQHRSTDWRTPAVILGFECMESIAYYGVNGNLVTYFSSIFHETNVTSATTAAIWSGTSYLTPLLGAIVADACLGNYWTVLISTLAFLPGMIALTLSAFLPSLRPLPCRGNLCPSATTAQTMVLFCGLYLVAFGSGGVHSSLLPLGADQFYDENQIDKKRKSSFFSSFYLCTVGGNLVASTLIVWIQVNVSWAFGYGLGTLCITLALVGFLLGTPIFRLVRPSGSPLKSVAQVLVASIRKMHLDVPSDSSLPHATNDKNVVEGTQQSAHTNSLRFLDNAETVSDLDTSNGYCSNNWQLCTVTQAEEFKILLRLLPLWISCAIYAVSYVQIYTTYVEQGNSMNTRIGSFSIPPASLQAFEAICAICVTVIFNKIIIPKTIGYDGKTRGLSLLQRIGVGHMLMMITMVVAAILEAKRLQSARVGESVSIAWQLPQYSILACSEVFCCVGLLEFFYDQAPNTMKSMCNSLFLLSMSLGSYLNSLIISFIMFLTTRSGQPGWLPEDLNEGHLDYIFWILSALNASNFLFYFICVRKYTPKKKVLEDENICF